MPKLSCILLLAAALWTTSLLPDARCARAAAVITPDSAADEQDLSAEREAHYTRAVRQWLTTLPEGQRERALKILREAHPGVHALRDRIREKKAELAALSFDSTTPPDTLPRLGRELQILREQLRRRLLLVSEQLSNEVGVPMGPLIGDGFWLNPQTGDQGSTPPGRALRKQKPESAVTPVITPVSVQVSDLVPARVRP